MGGEGGRVLDHAATKFLLQHSPTLLLNERTGRRLPRTTAPLDYFSAPQGGASLWMRGLWWWWGAAGVPVALANVTAGGVGVGGRNLLAGVAQPTLIILYTTNRCEAEPCWREGGSLMPSSGITSATTLQQYHATTTLKLECSCWY